MGVVKNSVTPTWASGSSTSSGTTSSVSLASVNGATVYASIVQVGTATTAATLQVQESPDGTAFYSPPTKLFTAGTAAATYVAEIAVDPTAQSVQVVYAAQSGGTSSTATIQVATASE